ncbi:MAG: hypothetical protein JWM21_4687 [Acidobacteria bacterium]|nr:hypothetical protein [Acidobacteriota bacterium]
MFSSNIRRKTIQTADSCGIGAASGLLLGLLVLLVPWSVSAQARWVPSAVTSDRNQAFVVSQNGGGEVACREATSEERRRIIDRSGGGPVRVIYSGAPRRKDSPYGMEKWTSDQATGLSLQVSAGLRIVLHGTSQLEQNQTARNAFIVAANRWEAIISTPITVVIDVDFGTTFFGQPYGNPNILGATGLAAFTGPYSDLRQRLIDTASTAAEQQLYNALPATAVPLESGSATSAEVSAPNARALGIVPDISDPNSVPLGQGDAGIGFNSAFQFDFNPDDGITSGTTDFDSVASHEIGHALGFISDAGEGAATPVVTVWDLFRFRSFAASLATFATAQRVLAIGGNQVFFGNQTSTFATLELPLSTGGPNPGPTDGDGRQSSHWKDDAVSSTRPYIGVMDPTLASGLRRTISENDIMAIDLFGYSIGLPPPARPPNDNFLNAIPFQNTAGTLTTSNVNATRESGEPNHVGFTGDKSIWYYWTSPVNGDITIDTIGSNFDTTLAVYTGAVLNQLNVVAQNDDISNGTNKASRVQFNVTANTTYRVVVDGWNGEYGNITVNWTATGVVPTPTPTPTPTPSPTPSPTPLPPPPCLDDTWAPTSMTNVPVARSLHTAIWTGTEMIVWGGTNGTVAVNSGSRYNPTTNTWIAMSTTNAPLGRYGHTAVWTGTEMIVWGGFNTAGGYLNSGSKYNPANDTWTTINSTNAPAVRYQHSAVWTGNEMIVWGGFKDFHLNTGGRYNPTTDSWMPTAALNAPVGRSNYSAVWTGSQMIVWGGQGNPSLLQSGGRYNPAADSWMPTATLNAPSTRASHTAVWNGSEMIIWGGAPTFNSDQRNTGGRYNPITDAWTPTTMTNVPLARSVHTAVWTGAEMIVWGGTNSSSGTQGDGGRYNSTSNTWISTCGTNAPTARGSASAVWTGREMIIWGGAPYSGQTLDTGARYLEQSTPALLRDMSGPDTDQIAALDSLLFLRDPFPVVNIADLLNPASDRHTRVIIFVAYLVPIPGEPSSAVIVNLVDSNNQSYDVPAEDVRQTANVVQVTFRLPDGLAVGACTVKLKAHGQVSNAGTIRIRT